MLDLAPPLSVTIAPLVRPCGGVRAAVDRIARSDFRAVQLSAAMKGLRPRELDRRGRKDVLAMLSRHGLMLSGLDLMIPHNDWLDAATQDRAAGAAMAAMDLAADLGRVSLSMTLPVENLGGDLADALLAAADVRGITLAVHAEHDLDGLTAWLNDHDMTHLGAAIDPAALLAAGTDPADAAVRLADHLRVARLDDHATTSVATAGGRCPVSRGDLDVLAYRAALSTCERLRSIVVELRDLAEPIAAMDHAADAWGVNGGPGGLQ